ncbi:MAG: ribonuclease H-like domain-containing protein [Synergistaceae bacterium]|jgi:uncharacterized protein YprB with RNaseH-like and TPR domain|nr:ribonuclease H-like domain-containing protein [Synergistaceae bacterium]
MKLDRFFENIPAASVGKNKETNGSGDIRGLPDGEWVSRGVYRTENFYKIGGVYGREEFGDPENMKIMSQLGAKSGVVFLDLETTGLSGGTGTYAFLCGLGATSGEYFKVTQYFLKSPAYEAQWLEAVDAGILEGTTLVTYNGIAFDVPMLHTRHIMSRLRPLWESFSHIDLLHLSRRFYRGYLESCSLGNVERRVLGMQRSGEDVPGSVIPSLYRQYLHTLDASGLSGVFYHNMLDIASLASLYCHIARALAGRSGDSREHLRAGDIWNDRGQRKLALYLWNMAASDPSSRIEATFRMAYFAKKNKDHVAAKNFFTNALGEMESNPRKEGSLSVRITALEELAKLEEHRFKSPDRALRHVRSALELVKKNRLYGGKYDAAMIAAMERRRTRLEKKIRETAKTGSDEN